MGMRERNTYAIFDPLRKSQHQLDIMACKSYTIATNNMAASGAKKYICITRSAGCNHFLGLKYSAMAFWTCRFHHFLHLLKLLFGVTFI